MVFTGIGVLLGVSLLRFEIFWCAFSKHSIQVVKDIIASYETLINLFERTQYFLQRLSCYIMASLTPEMTELLAKILAQVLSVLALSTKEMKDRRISTLIYSKNFSLSDNNTEKFMKRLIGKTEVEDGLQRLDMLTKEENLMTAACTLQVTGEICNDVDVIKDDTRDIKDDTHDIKDDTRKIKEDTRGIKDNTCDIKDDTRNIREDARNIRDDTRSIKDDTHDIKDDTNDIKVDTRGIKEDTCDIKEDTRNIRDDTRDIKDDTRNINDNLEINKRGMLRHFNVFVFVLIFLCHILYSNR